MVFAADDARRVENLSRSVVVVVVVTTQLFLQQASQHSAHVNLWFFGGYGCSGWDWTGLDWLAGLVMDGISGINYSVSCLTLAMPQHLYHRREAGSTARNPSEPPNRRTEPTRDETMITAAKRAAAARSVSRCQVVVGGSGVLAYQLLVLLRSACRAFVFGSERALCDVRF